MRDETESRILLLQDAYRAFNARDIDSALSLMAQDVDWPRAFKGGFIHGPDAIRAYWTEQWNEIDGKVTPLSFHEENESTILVKVHQVVKDLDGVVLTDETVFHRFTISDGLITRMELANLKDSS